MGVWPASGTIWRDRRAATSAQNAASGDPGPIQFHQTEDGRTRVEVRVEQETVWLTQKQMAELFQKDVRTINEHIGNIFEEAELRSDSVIRNFRTTAAESPPNRRRLHTLRGLDRVPRVFPHS